MFARCLAAAGLAWLLATAVVAQPAQPVEPSAFAEPAAIPLSELSTRAEETLRFLAELEKTASRAREISVITEALPEARSDLRHAARITEEDLTRSPSMTQLADLRAGWRVRLDELEGWHVTLAKRAASLDEQSERLADTVALWRATRDRARAEGAPAPVLARIAEIRRRVNAVSEQVHERLAVVLTLQDLVVQQREIATGSLAAVQQAREALVGRVFERDADPLWRVVVSTREGSWWQEARDAFEERRSTLSSYLGEERGVVAALGLVYLVVALALLGLRRQAVGWAEDDPRRASATVLLRHPLASALIVVLVLSRPLLANAPQVFYNAWFLAVLLPTLVVLQDLLSTVVARLTYGVAVFFVIDRVRDLLEGVPALERTVFCAELLVALGFVLWLLRPARLRALPGPLPLARALRLLTRASVLLLVAALVGNLIGYLTLARLAGEGVLRATYVAVALAGGYRVLTMLSAVGLGSRAARRLRLVRLHGRSLQAQVGRFLAILSGGLWLVIVLELFAVLEPIREALGAILGARLEVGELRLAVGGLLGFVLTIVATVWASRLVRFVLQEEVYPRARIGRGASAALSSTVHYAVLFLGLLFALGVVGVDFGRLTLLAGALGVGIGFGLQNLVNNFVSGLILLFERPVKVGDTVEVGALLGDVMRIGIRSSTVRTFDGAEVIVPNANLISDQVINWTLSDRQRRVQIDVGVRYGTDPERVLEILRRVATAHPDVLGSPEPAALFQGFGASSLDFQLRAWVANIDQWFKVASELRVAVNAALAEVGIEIPFPQRDLHLRSVDPTAGRALGAPGPGTAGVGSDA